MKHQRARKATSNNWEWSTRLAIGIAGLFTIFYGYGERLRGLDTGPDFVMFIGVLVLVAGVFPWRRITFLWSKRK
jgi:hypothetical protein